MKVYVKVGGLHCPKCGAGESHPNDSSKCLIKAYKVSDDGGYWWSCCLVCAGYYDKDLNETPENFDGSKGWF